MSSCVVPKIIAHRGASRCAPENTLAAFRQAKVLGATWIEFDVRLTADEIPVVFHDAKLERTTKGSGLVATKTWEELQRYEAGSWFSPDFNQEKIPTLQQVLALAEELALGINVEIKSDLGKEQRTAEKVMEVLQKHWPVTAPILVSSFSLLSLQTVRAIGSHLPLGLLLEKWIPDWQSHAKDLECVAVVTPYRLLNQNTIATIHSLGMLALAYTVDDLLLAERLFAEGVNGIFSNCL